MNQTVSCAAGALLDTWSSHSWTEGIQLETIQDMEKLVVRTENSVYEITVICGRNGDILVRGGRFFGGSFLKLRVIYVGFNLEIHFDKRLIITSRVRQISVLLP